MRCDPTPCLRVKSWADKTARNRFRFILAARSKSTSFIFALLPGPPHEQRLLALLLYSFLLPGLLPDLPLSPRLPQNLPRQAQPWHASQRHGPLSLLQLQAAYIFLLSSPFDFKLRSTTARITTPLIDLSRGGEVVTVTSLAPPPSPQGAGAWGGRREGGGRIAINDTFAACCRILKVSTTHNPMLCLEGPSNGVERARSEEEPLRGQEEKRGCAGCRRL